MDSNGGLLLSDLFQNQVKPVRDRNADGDALDLGDVLLFADGIEQPIDIFALPHGLAGVYNLDGTVDAADDVVWRKTDNSPSGYNTWRTHFGESVGGGAGADNSADAAVPEPTSLALILLAAAIAIASRRDAARADPVRRPRFGVRRSAGGISLEMPRLCCD